MLNHDSVALADQLQQYIGVPLTDSALNVQDMLDFEYLEGEYEARLLDPTDLSFWTEKANLYSSLNPDSLVPPQQHFYNFPPDEAGLYTASQCALDCTGFLDNEDPISALP